MKHVAKNLHIPTFPFLPLTRIWIRLIAGFGLKEAGTLEAPEKDPPARPVHPRDLGRLRPGVDDREKL